MLRDLDQVSDDLTQWATSDYARVPTGYSIFDGPTMGGIATGELMLFLARTGVGKTWFAVNVAAMTPTVPTVLISLEMHGRYLLKRLAGVHTDTPTQMIEQDLRKYGRSEAVDQTAHDFPLLAIEDDPGMGVLDISTTLDAYTEQRGVRPKMVMIDYLKLIRSFGDSEAVKVDEIAQDLKVLAREQDVGVVVLQQAKRGGGDTGKTNDGHRPLTVTDSAYGGEYAPDYVMGMYKPSLNLALDPKTRKDMGHDMRLQFLKTRSDGELPLEGVQHHWNRHTGKISELN